MNKTTWAGILIVAAVGLVGACDQDRIGSEEMMSDRMNSGMMSDEMMASMMADPQHRTSMMRAMMNNPDMMREMMDGMISDTTAMRQMTDAMMRDTTAMRRMMTDAAMVQAMTRYMAEHADAMSRHMEVMMSDPAHRRAMAEMFRRNPALLEQMQAVMMEAGEPAAPPAR